MATTTTIKAGESAKTITLHEGKALTLTGSTGAVGVAYQLDLVLGGTNSVKSWAVGSGSLPVIGPFTGTQIFQLNCSVGSISATVVDAVVVVSQASGIGTLVKASGDMAATVDSANFDVAFEVIRTAGKGYIQCPAGDYYFGNSNANGGAQSSRLAPSNCVIFGAGKGKTIFHYVWDGIPTNTQANILQLMNVDNIYIYGITFDAPWNFDVRTAAYSTDNDSYWNCIRAVNVSNLRVENCEFKNASFHGIIGVQNCSNWDIIDCDFHDLGSRACHVHAEGAANNTKIRMRGCNIYRNGRGPAYAYNCPGSMAAGSNVLTISNADFAAMSPVWPQVGTNITAIVKGAGAQGGDLIAKVASNNGVNTLTFVAGQTATLDVTNVPVVFSNIANSGIFVAFGGSEVEITDNFIHDENGSGIQYSTYASATRNLVATLIGNVSATNTSKMYFGKDIQASGTMSFFNGNPTNGQTIVINGTTITFVTSGATGAQVNIGGSLAVTLTNLQTLLSGGTVIPTATMTSYVSTSALTLIAGSSFLNTAGNALTMGAGTAGATLSAATLTGGALGDYSKAKAAITAAGQNNIRAKVDRAMANLNLVDFLGSALTLNDSEASITFGGQVFEIGSGYTVSLMTIVSSGGNLSYVSGNLTIKNNTIVNCMYGIGGAGAAIELDNIVTDSKLYGIQIGSGNGVTIKGQTLRSGVANVSFNVGSNIAVRDVLIDGVLDTCGGPNIHFSIAGASGGARDIKVSPNARIRNAGSNPNFLTAQQLLGVASGEGIRLQSDGVALYKTIQVGAAAITNNRGGGINVGYADKVQIVDTVFQDNGVNIASSQRSDVFCNTGCSDVLLDGSKHDNVDNVSNNQLVISTVGTGVVGITVRHTKSSYNRAGGGGATIQLGTNSTNFSHYDNDKPSNATISEPAYPAANKVTQATSRTTGVTLSTMSGQITGNNASLAAGATATFTVTNALVGLNDTVNVTLQDGSAPVNTVIERTVLAGAFKITLRNLDASAADTTTPIINFTVQKAFSALAA